MIKRYIFLTNCISGVGGSQLYVARKAKWLMSIGWEVDVFFFEKGKIMIDELKPFNRNRIPQLQLPLYVVSKKDKALITSRVYKDGYNKTIYESHLQQICLWGEYFSYNKGGINICFPLSENFTPLKDDERIYFLHKKEDGLLFGITKYSIPRMLKEGNEDEETRLSAVGCSTGNVSDIESHIADHIINGKTIISIGRLEKPYVRSMVESVLFFVRKHSDTSFNIILIGDSEVPGLKDEIVNKLREAKNLKVFCTGFINPIPRTLLKKADVAISSAGSVWVTVRERILTISVSCTDNKAIGICGITTMNSMNRTSEPMEEIHDVLEDVLFNNVYNVNDIKEIKDKPLDFSKHSAIIERCSGNLSYNVERPAKGSEVVKQMLYRLLGCNTYLKLLDLYGKLL